MLRCPDCKHLAFWHGTDDKTPAKLFQNLWGRHSRKGCIYAGCNCPRTVVTS